MESGIEPEVKKYFQKVLYSFSYGLLWLGGNATAGIYFGLAYRSEKPAIVIILFYVAFLLSLVLLLRYYYRAWKK